MSYRKLPHEKGASEAYVEEGMVTTGEEEPDQTDRRGRSKRAAAARSACGASADLWQSIRPFPRPHLSMPTFQYPHLDRHVAVSKCRRVV